jgi:hypothetical protein
MGWVEDVETVRARAAEALAHRDDRDRAVEAVAALLRAGLRAAHDLGFDRAAVEGEVRRIWGGP